MRNDIYQQVQHLLEAGKLIHAIKLVREEENIGLKEAKDKVEEIVRDIRSGRSENQFLQAKTDSEILEASSRPRAHSHTPARFATGNIEKELATEAFLFLQKGEVAKAVKVIQETKGINKSSAKRLVKMFYQQHPEYTSDEISRFMKSSFASNTSNSSTSTSSQNKSKKSDKPSFSFFKFIVALIILINIIRALFD